MNISFDTIFNKYKYIDLIEQDDNWLLHNTVSGIILKIDKLSALIYSTINGNTYNEILNQVKEIFGENETISNDIKELLNNFYELDVIDMIDNSIIHKPKVLLINPCYEFPNKTYKSLRITPPLGILRLGSILRENGYNVRLLDMLVEDIRPNQIKHYIDDWIPDIVGVSLNFTSTANVCFDIASELKLINDFPIFFGGNHATFTYEDILMNDKIDYVIRYHGEETIVELCDILMKKISISLDQCKGIAFRNINGGVETTVRRETLKDLNSLPLPAWDLLIPMHKYKDDAKWILSTSQGCPCACSFCSTSSFNNGSKIIKMSVDEIIKQIKHIINISYGNGELNIGFCDDAFTFDRNRIKLLCERIINENLKFNWYCNTRVDLVDEELIKLMHAAGCSAMLFGIESCNADVLKASGKKINMEQAKKAIELAKNIGMSVREMFILGLPNETEESMKDMENFFLDTKPQEVRFGMLSVYPGPNMV